MNRENPLKDAINMKRSAGRRPRVETFCELCDRTLSVPEGTGIAVCMDCHRAICSLEIGHD
jgi:hypothetical protein